MVEWRVVSGFPNYEVSNTGLVRRRETGRVRKQWTEQSGHKTVTLQNRGEKAKRLKVHRLVAKAFIPNPENHPFVRHLNDVPNENAVENLAWGTYSDNQLDSIRNGSHYGSSRTHCPQGHEYTPENTARRGVKKTRFCKKCDAETHKRNRRRGLEPDDPRHGKPTTRGNWGCNCDPCVVADRERLKKYA